MGRAVPEKGFEDLVEALRLLRDRRVRVPHVVLAAVGASVDLSPYQRRLAGRVAREQLDVSLVTRFSPEVWGLLAHQSIMSVIVPSRAEPFGRIPLEAYAAGAAPVVATRAGGLTELVVDGGSGYLAEPCDPPCGARRSRTLTRASGCASMAGRSSVDSTTGTQCAPCFASSLPGSPRLTGQASGEAQGHQSIINPFWRKQFSSTVIETVVSNMAWCDLS